MTPEVEAVLTTLPRRIKVGAYDWRIKVETEPSEDYGEANFDRAIITIWPANHQSPERVVGTVLHELLHVLDPDMEEETVLKLEACLISLFRDNPKLLNWIKRGLKQ
jgi:hypothetical protein